MKKFLENNAAGLFVSVLAAAFVILGLCGWKYLDFRGDENRELQYRAEAESAAYRLMDSLEAGDVILSYHYARLVRDNAARQGGRDTADLFAGLAETIRITGITEDMKATVTSYLDEGTAEHTEYTAEAPLPDPLPEPEEVAVIRQNDALAAAEEILGSRGVLSRAVRCRTGEFLFTCRNAYAVIDGKTSMPVEMGISLPPVKVENLLTAEECAAAADSFLRKYFPSVTAEIMRIFPDSAGNMTVEYRADGRRVTASVRRDTGKIVGYLVR